MQTILLKLAQALEKSEPKIAAEIYKLAGRYDKVPIKSPPEMQPAFKYIMYLKLMRGLPDPTFHHMKRKYLDTSPDVQQECQKELDYLINQDALKYQLSSAEIRKSFEEKLNDKTLVQKTLQKS